MAAYFGTMSSMHIELPDNARAQTLAMVRTLDIAQSSIVTFSYLVVKDIDVQLVDYLATHACMICSHTPITIVRESNLQGSFTYR
eukprot:scaffold356297_cov14-Prasinocladus_malaysianus.AAC.1